MDDDGLSDSEELSFTRKVVDDKLRVELVHARSNPARADSDGDGLSDAEELNETPIVVFDSVHESDALIDAMKSDGENVDLRKHGSTKTVTSSVWEYDTDGDGANDSAEYRARTDPRDWDSDNDGESDNNEILSDNTDPTVHDFRNPHVLFNNREVNNPAFSTSGPQYTLDFTVTDPSGIENIRVVFRSGKTLDEVTAYELGYGGRNPSTYHYQESELGGDALKSAGTFLGGTTVSILVEDTHGNDARIRAINNPSVIASNIKGSIGLLNKKDAKKFGRAAGYFHGAGEFGYSVTHPVETVTALKNLPKVARNPKKAYQAAVTQYAQRRTLNNPFPGGTAKHDAYDSGYTEGYFVFFIVETYSGAAAAKTLRNSRRIQQALKGVEKTRYVGKGLRVARQAKRATELPSKAVGKAAAWSVKQAKRPFARYSFRNSRTVGKLVSARRYIESGVPDSIKRANTQRRKLSAKWFRDADLGGRSADQVETAGKLMADKNPREVSRALRRMDDAEQRAFLDEGLDQSQRQRLFETWKRDPDVSAEDIGTVSQRYKQLDDPKADQLDTLIQRQGKDGIELAEEVDGDTLSRALSPDCASPSIAAPPRRPLGADRMPSLAAPSAAGSCHMEYLEAVADANRESFDTQKFFDLATDLENQGTFRDAVRNGDVPLSEIAEETSYRHFDEMDDLSAKTVANDVRETTVSANVDGESGSIDVNSRYYSDGEKYVLDTLESNSDEVQEVFENNDAGDLYDKYGVKAIRHLDETPDGDPVLIRGQIGEEVLQPEIASRNYGRGGFEYDGSSGTLKQGYIPKEDIPYDLDGGNQGFDGFAIDDDGNLVIIETKTKNSKGRVTNTGAFGETLSNDERQMSDEWTQDRLQNLVDNAETDKQKAFVRQLADDDGVNAIEISERDGEINLNEVNQQNLNTELIRYRDGEQSGELVSSGLRQTGDKEPTLDRVEIVNIGDVFQGI